MATDSGIIIMSSGPKTLESDMKKLEGIINDKILPVAEYHLNAEFKATFHKDMVKSTTKCNHQFGLIDQDLDNEFSDLKSIPINTKIRCIECREDFFLFTKNEIKGIKESKKPIPVNHYPEGYY